MLEKLPVRLEELPVCTRYAAIIPNRLVMSREMVAEMQLVLVDIWRSHIQGWEDGITQCRKLVAALSGQGIAQTDGVVEDNGHVLAGR
eukprot:607824-Heterocapsa_arctica.AAC.1